MDFMVFNIDAFEEAALQVAAFLDAEVDSVSGKCIVKRPRRFKVLDHGEVRNCKGDFEVSFSAYRQDGVSLNQAAICLMPEEYDLFIRTIMGHELPLPIHYTQRLTTDFNIYCLNFESFEPPGHFAERLAAALKAIDH